jgi:phage terminase large subunit-like protein
MPAWFSRVVITADLKFEAGVGDFASVQAWGESGPDLYLLKSRRGRVGYDDSVDWIDDFVKLFPSAEVCIEKAANGYAVLQTTKKKIRNVKGLKPWGKKKQRHAAATPTAKHGHCYLPLGAVFEEVVDDEGTIEMHDATEFVEELAGATQHDDQMDAASYAIIEIAGIGGYQPEAEAGQPIAEALAVTPAAQLSEAEANEIQALVDLL